MSGEKEDSEIGGNVEDQGSASGTGSPGSHGPGPGNSATVEDWGREKVLEPWDIWNHLPQISCTQITWLIFVVMLAIADGNFFGQGYILSYEIKKNHSLKYVLDKPPSCRDLNFD